MPKEKKMWDNVLTVIMSLLCLLWIYPIVLILLNSLKKEGTFTTSTVFQAAHCGDLRRPVQLHLRRHQDGLPVQASATASSSPCPAWPSSCCAASNDRAGISPA